MDRRNFLRNLAFGIVALPAVVKLAAAAKPTPRLVHSGRWVPNPAWESAPYDVHFAMSPRSFERMVPQRYVSGA